MTQWLVGPTTTRTDFAITDVLVGVDRGAFLLANQQKKMALAIGDFDSVTEKEFALIQRHAEQVIRLPQIKDETDFESAIRLATTSGSAWTALGFLGGPRQDHWLHAFLLLYKYSDRRLTLVDANNRITLLTSGTYDIHKEGYRFVSFYSWEPAVLTLDASFRYPVTKESFNLYKTLGISNELEQEQGKATVEGKILMIQANDETTPKLQ